MYNLFVSKSLFIVAGVLSVIALIIFGLKIVNEKEPNLEKSEVNLPSATAAPKKEDFTATFEIYTNGTKRVFNQAMYHNLSSEVYIENPDPSLIYVKKPGTTWDGFFKTLPFSLTEDCLITGTKQQFCSTETKKLTFVLNNENNQNALDLEIKQGDKLVVTYGN